MDKARRDEDVAEEDDRIPVVWCHEAPAVVVAVVVVDADTAQTAELVQE